MPTPKVRLKQRVPLIIYDDEITLMLKLKHRLENDWGKPIPTGDVFKLAMVEFAKQLNITIN